MEKKKKKNIMLRIEKPKKIETIEIKDAAKALWNLIVEIERTHNTVTTDSNKNISSNYKEHLYGKNGILN